MCSSPSFHLFLLLHHVMGALLDGLLLSSLLGRRVVPAKCMHKYNIHTIRSKMFHSTCTSGESAWNVQMSVPNEKELLGGSQVDDYDNR